MANKTATVTSRIEYVDEDDADQLKLSTATITYGSSIRGELDVPDQTASSEVYDIPLGSIEAITCVWVKNKTGQDMTLTVNGQALHDLADQGEVLLSEETVSGSPIVSVSLTTTGTQDGAGKIPYLVLGDPEAP